MSVCLICYWRFHNCVLLFISKHFAHIWQCRTSLPHVLSGYFVLKKKKLKKEEETFELFLFLVGHNSFFKTIAVL